MGSTTLSTCIAWYSWHPSSRASWSLTYTFLQCLSTCPATGDECHLRRAGPSTHFTPVLHRSKGSVSTPFFAAGDEHHLCRAGCSIRYTPVLHRSKCNALIPFLLQAMSVILEEQDPPPATPQCCTGPSATASPLSSTTSRSLLLVSPTGVVAQRTDGGSMSTLHAAMQQPKLRQSGGMGVIGSPALLAGGAGIALQVEQEGKEHKGKNRKKDKRRKELTRLQVLALTQ